ncbi:MAG TPA: hypothetical protein VFE70_07460 [Candidatus Elarobacter sp.]|nr:hypothetical protein [Candidatus Elarobacter sp.]
MIAKMATCNDRAKKATGTAFVERDALSGVKTELDRISLSQRERRRNTVLERAGVEPARRECQIPSSDRRIAPAWLNHAPIENDKAAR